MVQWWSWMASSTVTSLGALGSLAWVDLIANSRKMLNFWLKCLLTTENLHGWGIIIRLYRLGEVSHFFNMCIRAQVPIIIATSMMPWGWWDIKWLSNLSRETPQKAQKTNDHHAKQVCWRQTTNYLKATINQSQHISQRPRKDPLKTTRHATDTSIENPTKKQRTHQISFCIHLQQRFQSQ